MKREYPDTPIVGVGALIIEDGRIVLIKRGKSPLQGEWSIPGGAMEIGETVREAAAREACEETGLHVVVEELLGVYDRLLRDEEGRVRYHYLLVDFLCRRTSGKLFAAGDAAEACWFTAEEVEQLALPEDTKEVIRLGFERSSS